MQIDVDITPKQINDAIVSHILKSELGQAIKTKMEEFLNKEHSYGSKNLNQQMEAAVDNCLSNIVVQVIRDNYKDAIVKEIQKRMSQEVLDQFVNKAWETLSRSWK